MVQSQKEESAQSVTPASQQGGSVRNDAETDASAGALAGTESAAVVDLVAAELDEQDRLDATRLPLIVRVYGVLVLLDGLVTLPIVVLASIAAVKSIMRGELTFDAASLTAVLTALQALVLIASAIALVVFGVLLLRNRRRYAARWAYVLMPVTLAEGMLSLALEGLGANLIAPGVRMALLVAVSVACDPGLIEERRLQRALKRMDDRSAYESAVKTGMLGRDPSGKGYIALDFFNIFWLFTVACVFGLAIETVYHMTMYHGELQDRAGLLWGPFSPIYGCGAVLVTVSLNRLWKSNPFLIFCASAVIGGAFEYATSWFMEVAFGITAWDYTGQWLSIDGRTSGKYMVFWGLIGVVWVRWILPRLLALINRIPWKVRYSLTTVCAVLMVVDIVFTLMALDCWYGRMAGLPQDSPITQWFAMHYGDDFMANRFQTMSIDPAKAGRA